MTADNDAYYRKLESNKTELNINIVDMEYQILNASILLTRWSQWAKTFGSLMYDQKDFVELQKDTEKFFNVGKKK